ncbi:hypothetical protein E2C01_038379 [Portunus trituberculatus]|uniref:Uncharacterized protein n=1 Tax=Portunus trituberculatus TaxID=210409 RepID=A0A5B7FC28_PORTR|nr:hypothetical protein [Portunus trituberculatus]
MCTVIYAQTYIDIKAKPDRETSYKSYNLEETIDTWQSGNYLKVRSPVLEEGMLQAYPRSSCDFTEELSNPSGIKQFMQGSHRTPDFRSF